MKTPSLWCLNIFTAKTLALHPYFTNQPPYSLLNAFDFVSAKTVDDWIAMWEINMSARRNSCVTSKYLSRCVKRKRRKTTENESRTLPKFSDLNVNVVDEEASIFVSEIESVSPTDAGCAN